MLQELLQGQIYDNKTDRIVGFVLPCNNAGLLLSDMFLAALFAVIKKMFATTELAKFEYAYVPQPVCLNVPAFCFACMGSNNQYTADDFFQRWSTFILSVQHKG